MSADFLLYTEAVGGYQVEFFKEGVGSDSFVSFEGIVAQADKINRNGRIYPSELLFEAVDDYIDTRLKAGLAMGELDHPDTLTVQMQKVSHLFTDLRTEGSNVIGKARLAKTPMGDIARGLVETGVQLGVSTRGGGRSRKVRGIDQMEVFIMTAIDIVSFPSASDALPRVIKESVEFLVESGLVSRRLADKTTRNRMTSEQFQAMVRGVIKGIPPLTDIGNV
jgi:hypothetical protein